MTGNFANLFQWLENTSWAISIRQSLWLYPILEIIHILGIVLVAGAAVLFDLRLLGFTKKISIEDMADHLLVWSKRGLFLVIPSGILLFMTNAETLGFDTVFHIKLILLFLAGLNAWIFHAFIFKFNPGLTNGSRMPAAAKFTAISSVILWIAIIACGRLLAY